MSEHILIDDSPSAVTVVELSFSDVVLMVLLVLALLKLLRLSFGIVTSCCRSKRRNDGDKSGAAAASSGRVSSDGDISPTLVWREHLLGVLQRPMKKSAVHADLLRLSDRLLVDGQSFLAAASTTVESIASRDRSLAIVESLLDKLDAGFESGGFSLADVRREFRDALNHAQRDASEQLLNLFATLPTTLRTLAVLRAATNQGVLAPSFIAVRRHFASDQRFADVRFNNEPRSWSLAIETHLPTKELDAAFSSSSSMRAYRCPEISGQAPPVLAASPSSSSSATAATANTVIASPLTANDFISASKFVTRIRHMRQFDCMRYNIAAGNDSNNNNNSNNSSNSNNNNNNNVSLHFRFKLFLNILIGFASDKTVPTDLFAIGTRIVDC